MRKLFTLLAILFLSVACNNGNKSQMTGLFGVTPPTECTAKTKMQFVYDVMHDSYLWADETKELTQAEIFSHGNEATLLNALRHKKDRFSYIQDAKGHNSYFEKGKTKSFGFTPSVIRDENGTFDYLSIGYVFPNSPMDIAGIKRGDKILGIDGFDTLTILRSDILIDRYFGGSSDDLTARFELQDRNVTVARDDFDIKAVSHYKIIDSNGTKVAYIHFKTFIATSNDALDNAFAYFKEQGIDELVLDLRYNGGGYVYVANHLSSLIGGKYVEKRVLEYTLFNAKYREFDYVRNFEERPEYALDLKRVFILADNSSASASELVINALSAKDNEVEVIQIGTPTRGKPYGMIGGEYCNSYILPIQNKGVNADGFGDYDEGLIPQCKSYNNIDFALGDIRENLFSDALYYMKNGTCKEKYSKNRSLTKAKKEPLIYGFRGMYGIY